MPYASKRQRAYLHIHEPKLAARWDREYGAKPKPKKLRRTTKSSPRK